MIYFIRTSSGLIKIGTTRNIRNRMIYLQKELKQDLALLATMPGGRTKEMEVHRIFQPWRLDGTELFEESPLLMEYIDKAKQAGPAPNERPDLERLEFQIPPELSEIIRVRAAKERRSVSLVAAEILARGLGLDPAEFGVEPTPVESAPSQ